MPKGINVREQETVNFGENEQKTNRMKMQDPHKIHIVREHCRKQKRKQREKSGGLLKRERLVISERHTHPPISETKALNFGFKKRGFI